MDPMNAQNAYEHEIDLKDLLFVILHQWKPVIAVAIAFAVLIGGLKGIPALRNQGNAENAAEKEEEYKAAMEQYENAIAYSEREIQNIVSTIETQQEYLENSILMNLNPYSLYEAKSDLFIKTDYEIMPGMVYQNTDYTNTILQAYQSIITSSSFLADNIASDETDIRYLQELVSVQRGSISAVSDPGSGKTNNTGSSSGNTELTNILTITVRHSNAEDAEKILDGILSQIDTLHRQIVKNVGDHTVQSVNKTSESAVDWVLADKQAEEMRRLQTLRDTLTQKEEALNEFPRPSAASSTGSGAVKAMIKYGVLGFVLGGFIIVFFICVWFLMSDRLYSSKELRTRFQVKLLGTLPAAGKSKQNRIDTWLDRLEGRAVQASADSEYQLIAANIKNHTENIKTILVAGCASNESITQVASYLKEHLPALQIIAGGNLLQSADAILKLPECDGIVLIEQCGVSAYQAIELELEKISDLKKEILGFVVFE